CNAGEEERLGGIRMKWLEWLWAGTPRDTTGAPVDRVTIRSEAKTASGSIELVKKSVDLASMVETALRPLVSQARAHEVALIMRFEDSFPRTLSCDGLKL